MLAAAILATTLVQTATIKVFVVSYFPVKGDQIDHDVTREARGPYIDLKAKTETLTAAACKLLEEGSRFRGYKRKSTPALRYGVVGQV